MPGLHHNATADRQLAHGGRLRRCGAGVRVRSVGGEQMKPTRFNDMSATIERNDFLDRKRTLPRRVIKVCLSLASLRPGRYIYIVDVPEQGDLLFEQAALKNKPSGG